MIELLVRAFVYAIEILAVAEVALYDHPIYSYLMHSGRKYDREISTVQYTFILHPISDFSGDNHDNSGAVSSSGRRKEILCNCEGIVNVFWC